MSKEVIKDAAFRLFAEKGYEITTMKDIAREVGIKAPSIYTHYRSKEDLFLEIVDDTMNKFSIEIKNIFNIIIMKQGYNVEEILYHMVYNTFKFFSQNEHIVNFWKIVIFFPPDFLKGKINPKAIMANNNNIDLFVQVLQYGMESGQIKTKNMDTVTRSFFAFLHGYMLYMFTRKMEFTEEQIRNAWNLYWYGIKN